MELTSDASGSWGCGAWHQNSWFQLQWDVRSSGLSIAEKELIPIVLAAATWGGAWQGRQVLCHCDNQVVVAGLRSRTSKHKGVMQLLRCFVFVEAHFGFYLYPSYIGTKANHLADDLSRNHLCSFLSKVPWPTATRRQCPSLSWTFCWTPRPTGPLRLGTNSSGLFSERPSPVDTKVVPGSPETVP